MKTSVLTVFYDYLVWSGIVFIPILSFDIVVVDKQVYDFEFHFLFGWLLFFISIIGKTLHNIFEDLRWRITNNRIRKEIEKRKEEFLRQLME